MGRFATKASVILPELAVLSLIRIRKTDEEVGKVWSETREQLPRVLERRGGGGGAAVGFRHEKARRPSPSPCVKHAYCSMPLFLIDIHMHAGGGRGGVGDIGVRFGKG